MINSKELSDFKSKTKESIREAWRKSNIDLTKAVSKWRTRRSNMIDLNKVSEVTKKGRDFLEKSALKNRIKKLEEENEEQQNQIEELKKRIEQLEVRNQPFKIDGIIC